MNKFFIIFLSVVCLAVYSEQQPGIRCPPNQVYNTCGSRCPPACDRPRNQICTRECVRGCFCLPGLLLRSYTSNVCVYQRMCPR